ncbi:5-hydroxytryptamine receptor 3A-like [Antennarius striatus]|uniref:5-hydroxytryptamine receptor 3A-like n=1 Tax=Antennarius striatus TaxID=241820 RepID=UPI0035B480D5
MLTGVFLLILLAVADGQSSSDGCSFRDLLSYLKLRDNSALAMSRPIRNYNSSMEVTLDILLYAILDVNEKAQKMVSYVWVDMMWQDEYISWNPEDFCYMNVISIPTKVLWKPDLSIEEMTEKDKASQSPYLIVKSEGRVSLRNDMMVISTCRIHVYKFPFDTQSCDLSFKSVVHSVEELYFVPFGNSSGNTEWSRMMMRTQSDWVFINMEISNKTVDNFGLMQSMLVCTINLRRRPNLYIVNFMLPILFFLSLDFASFLISDSGGEKLSFKVTLMLAVTVMQLILNEILPSSSDRIPLIAVYCVGIFCLMLLSVVETIVVMHLIEKDSKGEDKDRSLSEDSAGQWAESQSELCPVNKQGSSDGQTEESFDLEKLSELRETLAELRRSRKEEGEKGYWSRKVALFALTSPALSYNQ